MNIRKPTDYVTMFTTLDTLMAAQLPQMELYREIGRVVSGRAEKGAAVAVSEYLQAAYPTAEGFSPRNLRPIRLENVPKNHWNLKKCWRDVQVLK